MGRTSQEALDPLTTGERLLLLAAINVLQPASRSLLEQGLSPDLSEVRLNAGIAGLRKEGLIRRIPHRGYVVTRRGCHAAGIGVLGRQRDIDRLRYLFERAKEGE